MANRFDFPNQLQAEDSQLGQLDQFRLSIPAEASNVSLRNIAERVLPGPTERIGAISESIKTRSFEPLKQSFKKQLQDFASQDLVSIGSILGPASLEQAGSQAAKAIAKTTQRGVNITQEFADYAKNIKDLGPFEYKSTALLDPLRAAEKLDAGESGLIKNTLIRPIQEADDKLIKEADQLKQRVSNLAGGITAGSEADQLIRKWGEKSVYPENFKPEDAKKITPQIQKAAEGFREIYDELLDRVNTARKKAGQEAVPKRRDYFTHSEELGILTSIFGSVDNIPGDMLRAAPFTKPNAKFFKFALPRNLQNTTAGAVEGFERYMQAALPVIHYTDPILNLRGHVEFLPPKASAYFNDLANTLAGKKSALDRPMPEPVLKFANLLRRLTSKGMILGNFSTAFLQPSSIASTISRAGLINTLKAIPETFSDIGIETAEKYSKVLRGRTFNPEINPNTLNKFENVLAYGISTLDRIMVRNAFLAGLKKATQDLKLPLKEAVNYADDLAQKTQASNRKIFQPPLLQSEVGGTLGQLQTFTTNLYNQIRRDIPLIKKEKGALEAVRAAIYLGASMVAINKLYEEVGLPQPYDLVSFIPGAGSVRFGEPTPALAGAVGLAQTTFGEGRTREEGVRRLGKFAVSLVPGGRQAQKTLQGIEAIREGGSRTPSGRLRFPIKGTAEQTRALLFGPYQTKAGQQFLGETNPPTQQRKNRFQ